MPVRDQGTLARAWGRVGRMSRRAGQRVRGMPLRAACRREGLPVPPGRLLHTIGGSEDVSWFLTSGAVAASCLRDALARHGATLDGSTLLDFGCGVGRVVRHWAGLRGAEVHGTDYNPDLVAWCAANLPFARFRVNGLDRPLGYAGGTFDVIYSLSVFTHLSEPLNRFWAGELARVLKPGGLLFVTTHGARYLDRLSADEVSAFRSGELIVHQARREGSNDCATFHPEAYVRSVLAPSAGLDVLEFTPEGALGTPHQDAWLLRKPA